MGASDRVGTRERAAVSLRAVLGLNALFWLVCLGQYVALKLLVRDGPGFGFLLSLSALAFLALSLLAWIVDRRPSAPAPDADAPAASPRSVS